MNYKFKMSGLWVIASIMAVSCDSYRDTENIGVYVEADKNLAAVWQLSSVARNGVDITNQMDCGQFKLHLEENGRYSLENRLPFPVADDGVWKVDDPKHPFRLSFTEDNYYGDPVDVDILFPVVDGRRQLSITHSPGCETNKYIYVFVESNK